ncbi:hypothetical protein RRG08_036350 [Elysia crispata]|uniref:Uncharacterized protein n=1 Tax=Elysia crispata TaxID=231223 RepID=A0AAE0ZK45_9GAST|nr:hypothetical protein RRG08_036350 [Elysia crispata]
MFNQDVSVCSTTCRYAAQLGDQPFPCVTTMLFMCSTGGGPLSTRGAHFHNILNMVGESRISSWACVTAEREAEKLPPQAEVDRKPNRSIMGTSLMQPYLVPSSHCLFCDGHSAIKRQSRRSIILNSFLKENISQVFRKGRLTHPKPNTTSCDLNLPCMYPTGCDNPESAKTVVRGSRLGLSFSSFVSSVQPDGAKQAHENFAVGGKVQ